MNKLKNETQALHIGYDSTLNQGAQSVPIYQTSSYVFHDANHAAGAFNLSIPTYIYSRLNNPTNDVLEQRLAALEGGIAAVVTASGASAISTTFLTLLKSGDHIVSAKSLYGGTYNLFNVTLRRYGIETTFVDTDNIEEVRAAIQPNTRALFAETIGNPKLDVLDLERIAEVSKEAGIPFIVDNTLATPYLLQPLAHGAHIVIHSLTKYISGNGTSLGGVIVDGGTFDWANGNFPEFTSPSLGYHGLIYHDAVGRAAFGLKVRVEGLRDLGAALSPFNAFQIIQGLETLALRIEKHSKNAFDLASWLAKQPEVAWVNYPGLPNSPYNKLAQKYLSQGQSGIVTFALKGGYEAAKQLVGSTKLFALLANIGDTKSLIIHPASTTHEQLSVQDQLATGVSPDLIRLSVGLENIEDLKDDLQRAFNQL